MKWSIGFVDATFVNGGPELVTRYPSRPLFRISILSVLLDIFTLAYSECECSDDSVGTTHVLNFALNNYPTYTKPWDKVAVYRSIEARHDSTATSGTRDECLLQIEVQLIRGRAV
jgi:hypothetical protein